MDIIEQIEILNNKHISLFKASLIDESINIVIDNLEDIKEDLRRVLECIDIWLYDLYKDDIDIEKYYNNLRLQIISILNK